MCPAAQLRCRLCSRYGHVMRAHRGQSYAPVGPQ
jgi:hypothetical protein